MVTTSAALRRQQAPGWSRSKALRKSAGHNKEGDRVMKIASNIIVAAALVLASAPAFAHGGGMGGMGGNMGGMGMSHGNGTTVTHTNVNFDKNTTKTTTKTIFRRIEFVRIRREILRLDREILRLIRLGKGNSPLVKGLEFQKAKLLQEGHFG
jgi:hypothetical protein